MYEPISSSSFVLNDKTFTLKNNCYSQKHINATFTRKIKTLVLDVSALIIWEDIQCKREGMKITKRQWVSEWVKERVTIVLKVRLTFLDVIWKMFLPISFQLRLEFIVIFHIFETIQQILLCKMTYLKKFQLQSFLMFTEFFYIQ